MSGASKDDLHIQTRKMLQDLGCHASTVSEVLKQEDSRTAVFKAIQKGLERANEEALVPSHKVPIVLFVARVCQRHLFF